MTKFLLRTLECRRCRPVSQLTTGSSIKKWKNSHVYSEINYKSTISQNFSTNILCAAAKQTRVVPQRLRKSAGREAQESRGKREKGKKCKIKVKSRRNELERQAAAAASFPTVAAENRSSFSLSIPESCCCMLGRSRARPGTGRFLAQRTLVSRPLLCCHPSSTYGDPLL